MLRQAQYDKVCFNGSMQKKLIIANWKSHKTKVEAVAWLGTFKAGIKKLKLDAYQIVLTPSFPFIDLVSQTLSTVPSCAIGAQDVSQYPLGKYTGAVAATQLKSSGCSYVLIGHSERRHYFKETSQIIAQKIDQALDNQLQPIVCVTQAEVENQAAMLNEAARSKCIVFYEPIGAIGTGMGEDVSQVQAVTRLIKASFGQVPVLYGGSVSAQNINEYLLVADGVGVGTASLEATEFLELLQKIEEN